MTVSDGHAQNFLFPQNMAVPATADVMARRAQVEKVQARSTNKQMSVAGDLAARLEGYEFTLKEKVSEAGVLYAAVRAKAVASALKKAGFKVNEKMIIFKEPIKELGTHELTVQLDHGFEAKVSLSIEQT